MTDPYWLITQGHSKLVDVRLGYEGVFTGNVTYDDLMESLAELNWLVKQLHEAIPHGIQTVRVREPVQIIDHSWSKVRCHIV